jgi:ubiquinone/menaquinone biosynthesis C-methylase UbiE
VRRIALGVWRRVNPKSTAGLTWKRQGELITFDWDGFVAAPSIPGLFARHHYETRLIRELLAGKRIERSLEFGCGFGRLSPTFAALSAEHTAIDINAEALEAARGAYPDLDFRLSSGGTLPFADATFDLIVTWTVLQHVRPETIDDVLADLVRVARPGARILLCEETREPGAKTRHAWHRTPEFYAERLQPLRLTYSSYIEAIDRLPGLVSPGRVMLFEPADDAH